MTDREKALADALDECVRLAELIRVNSRYIPASLDGAIHEIGRVARTALALPERSDPTDSWVVPGPVFRWLLGEEGDFVDPSGTNRPYFWRKKLRDSALRLRAPAAPVAELSGKPGYANMDGRDLGRGSGMVYDLAAVHASAPAGELSDRERARGIVQSFEKTMLKYFCALTAEQQDALEVQISAEFAAVRASSATLVNDFMELDHLLQRMRTILASK